MIALTAGFVDFRVTVASGAVEACAPVRPSTTAAPNPTPSAVRRSRRPCLDSRPSFNCLVMLPTSLTSNRLFAESSLMSCLPASNNRPTSLTTRRLLYSGQCQVYRTQITASGYTFCGDVQMTFWLSRVGVVPKQRREKIQLLLLWFDAKFDRRGIGPAGAGSLLILWPAFSRRKSPTEHVS